MRKFGHDGEDMAMASFGAWTKCAQAIAVELADYSKKSAESAVKSWEKIASAKSLDKAFEVHSDYLKSSYQDFIAQAAKLGELYVDLAKESYTPFENAFTKAATLK
jgi:hypothetical protein